MNDPSQTPEQQQAEVQKMLKDLGKIFGDIVPYHWGFVILLFPFGHDGRMNYVSNADRPDVVRAMYEFITATKGQWAKEEEPLGAAAEDELLGRARQRVAELEREREEMVDFCTRERARLEKLENEVLNLTQVKDLEYLMEIAAAHLVARSPFNSKWHDRAKKYQALFHERMVKMEEAK